MWLRSIAIVLCSLVLPELLAAAQSLASYQRQTWQTENGLPQNTVHAIVQTHDGYLWLATEGGVVRFDGLKFTVYDSQNTPSLHSNNIRALFEDAGHALWIATADGLTVFRAGTSITYTREQGLPSNSIWSIEKTADGSLSVLTASGRAEYKDGRFVAREVRETADTTPGAKLQDHTGAIWTAGSRGVVRTTGGVTEAFPSNDPLANDVVLALLEDREGNIWLGTETNGLTVLRNQKITTYSARDGLTDDLVRCVYQDSKGALWFGTNGGLTKFELGRMTKLTVRDGLSSNFIFALGETRTGDLLVGTQDGLNVLHQGNVQVLTTSDGLADDLVRSLFTDTDGAVWIGTRRGLTLWKDNKFRTFTEANGLASDLVGAVTRDHDGALWVATLRGLTRIKDGRFQTFTTRDGLASNVVTALHADNNGVLWIGTQDGGLHRMQNGHVTQMPPTFGLPASIYAIVEDDPFLWLTSKAGVFRVDKRELETSASVAPTTVQYGTADGMRVNECSEGGHPAAWLARDGSPWFATLRGVSTMQGQTARSLSVLSPAVVESFSVDDHAIDLHSTREIPPGHDRLAFEYTGITFVSPQSVRFRYKLDGFDRDWVYAGTRRTAYYTSLPPGEYRFHVSARANDGVWSTPEASVAFRLLPHFYQTYWFYLLLVAAAALAVYGVYSWRVQQVESQFNAVLAERNRIAREIHDTLAQGFVAVSLQLELLGRNLSNAPENVRNLVQQTRQMVQSSLEEARRSIWELRSQGADSTDFRSRLARMANDIGKRAALQVQFHVLGTYRALPENVETELLKIAQEAVTNVARHAQAQQLKIDLAYEEKKLRLIVADDGRGFAGDAPEGHFGLRGMKERAAKISAEITIHSTPGKGTAVEIEKIVS